MNWNSTILINQNAGILHSITKSNIESIANQSNYTTEPIDPDKWNDHSKIDQNLKPLEYALTQNQQTRVVQDLPHHDHGDD